MNLKKALLIYLDMLETFMNKDEIEVGLDEAGRGPLFGRVYVGCLLYTSPSPRDP